MIRMRIRSIHRWASIAMLGFWMIQLITGLLLVFQWEIDDATVAGPRVPTDIAAIDARLTMLINSNPNLRIRALNTTGSGMDRYDVLLEGAGERTTLRIDGMGNVLRHQTGRDKILFDIVDDIHENLLAGDAGAWVVGVSGLLLLSNIILGLVLSWPGQKLARWRMALRPTTSSSRAARIYGWHRAAGLWMAIPALVTIGCGTALVFYAGVERAIGVERQNPRAQALTSGQSAISMRDAVASARRLYPHARLTRIDYPTREAPFYGVQFRQQEEQALIFGSTMTYVAAADGRIVGQVNPFTMSVPERALDLLYPIHTGEIGGLAGRIAIAAVGLWLGLMLLLGFWLWGLRRRSTNRAKFRASKDAETQ